MTSKNDLEILKDKFIKHLLDVGKSDKTIENYNRYLNFFVEYIGVLSVKKIDDFVIDKFISFLKSSKYSAKTQNYHITALRMFLKYLNENNYVSINIKNITLNKTSDIKRYFINEKDVIRVLSNIDNNDIKSLRDKAILYLLFYTGIKVSELCLLNKSADLSVSSVVIHGRNGVRTVYLNEDVKSAIHEYLRMRNDDSEAMFVNSRKRVSKSGSIRITSRSIQRIVKFYFEKAGIYKKVTPSMLRHLFAKTEFENKTDIASIGSVLGYKNTVTAKKILERYK